MKKYCNRLFCLKDLFKETKITIEKDLLTVKSTIKPVNDQNCILYKSNDNGCFSEMIIHCIYIFDVIYFFKMFLYKHLCLWEN